MSSICVGSKVSSGPLELRFDKKYVPKHKLTQFEQKNKIN